MSDIDRVIVSIRKFRDHTKDHLDTRSIALLTLVANVLTHYPPSENSDLDVWEESVQEFLTERAR